MKSASTQKGFSLAQVAVLSKKAGLNYQMAFRERGSEFVLPAVVHWKVGHYAALVRKEGNVYQMKDPTFGNETWGTKEALEAETTGYFLIPQGELAPGWRKVEEKEGAAVWGKGQTSFNDGRQFARRDLKTSDMSCRGMTVASIHLMLANLNLNDEPVGYSPLGLDRRKLTIALAASVTAFAVLPLGVIAAVPRLHDGPRSAVRVGNSLVPVSSSIGLAAKAQGDVVQLSWRARSAGAASVFYRVLRTKGAGGGAACPGRLRNSPDSCQLYMDDTGSSRVTSFADRPGPGTWSYRIGVAANWLDDPTLGDIYVVSRPVSVTIP